MINIRTLLNLPATDNREFYELAHAIIMSETAHMSQKIVALRLLDGVIGGTDDPIDAQEVANYISTYLPPQET